MKIAFVAQPLDSVLPPNQNSIGIWIYEIARRLARKCSVTIYLRGDGAEKRSESVEGVNFLFVPMTWDWRLQRYLLPLLNLRGRKRPAFASWLNYLGYILQVSRDVRRESFDVVQLFNFSQFVPVVRLFNPHSKIALRMSCEWLTQLDPALVGSRLKRVDQIIGCSEFITDRIRVAFPQLADRCHTVYNGRDVSRFTPREENAARGGGDEKQLLFVGRVSPEKGVHVLLDAFRLVLERHPRTKLTIVGGKRQLPYDFLVALSVDPRIRSLGEFYNGDDLDFYFSRLRDRARQLGVDAQLEFIGSAAHEALPGHYRAADVFAFPSVWDEPSGNPPIEAMACGVPVVSTLTGGTPEYVKNGETGFLVEAGDARALAAAILRLLDDDDLRQTMGSAARRRAAECFSSERLARDLLSRYEALLTE